MSSLPKDMYISGMKSGGCYIECPLVGEFSLKNEAISIGTILTPSQYESLKDSTAPGKYEKWDVLFGNPVYWDTTFISGNTLEIKPLSSSFSAIWSGDKIVVKDISAQPIGRPPQYYYVRIDGFIKGSL